MIFFSNKKWLIFTVILFFIFFIFPSLFSFSEVMAQCKTGVRCWFHSECGRDPYWSCSGQYACGFTCSCDWIDWGRKECTSSFGCHYCGLPKEKTAHYKQYCEGNVYVTELLYRYNQCVNGGCASRDVWEVLHRENCGTSSWTNSYRCSGNNLQRLYVTRGCSDRDGCFQSGSWRTVQPCGTNSWTNNYRCSADGRYVQRQRIDRGCRDNRCYETVYWVNFTDCGTNSWTNNYRCSADGRYVQRQAIIRGCSNNNCYSATIWQNITDCRINEWTNNYRCSADGRYVQRQRIDGECRNNQCRRSPTSWHNHTDCHSLGQICEDGKCIDLDDDSNVQNLSTENLYKCSPSNPEVRLTWDYTGDDENVSFDAIINGKEQNNVISGMIVNPEIIDWNQNYSWKLRVKEQGKDPVEVNGPQFTTPLNQYPIVNFDWEVEEDDIVSFINDTQCFSDNCSYQWTIPDAEYVEGTSNSFEPKVRFLSEGDKEIKLEVTDIDLESDPNSGPGECGRTKIMREQYPHPDWEEVTPFGKIINFIKDTSLLIGSLFR